MHFGASARDARFYRQTFFSTRHKRETADRAKREQVSSIIENSTAARERERKRGRGKKGGREERKCLCQRTIAKERCCPAHPSLIQHGYDFAYFHGDGIVFNARAHYNVIRYTALCFPRRGLISSLAPRRFRAYDDVRFPLFFRFRSVRGS